MIISIHAGLWVGGPVPPPATEQAPVLITLPDGSSFFVNMSEPLDNLLSGRSVVHAYAEPDGDTLRILGEAPEPG